MAGTSLIVPDGARPSDPPFPARRPMRGYVLAGIALSGWVGFLLLALALLLSRPGTPIVANANIADVPALLVGPVIVADPWVATALPIQIGPSAPRGSWIRIAGIPALASLSAGHTIGSGTWKVPLVSLSTLTVMAPNRESVRSDVHIALMSASGSLLVEVQSVLVVIPPAMCGAVSATTITRLPDDVAPGAVFRPSSRLPVPVLTTNEDRRRAQELVLLGEIQRLQGRFGSARGYYEQAASMGWPRGAMALAETFDPYEIGGTTVSPDVEAASAWYRRSRELMDASIEYYLKRLAR